MKIDIIVPNAGESISQVELARWLVANGSWVEKDQEIAEIDSDKATLSISASQAGIITILVDEGTTLEPGKIIGNINTALKPPESKPELAPSQLTDDSAKKTVSEVSMPKGNNDTEVVLHHTPNASTVVVSPQARRLLDEKAISLPDTTHIRPNKRITSKDILQAISSQVQQGTQAMPTAQSDIRTENRQKMSTLRRKLSERLVAVKNQTAMLTSFQEVDMSAVLAIRKKYQKDFLDAHGVKLGLMAFFTKAVTLATRWYPQVNGRIENDHIVLPDYVDVGIAVSTPKGLVVPVVRNAQSLTIAQIEQKIADLAQKARNNKIGIQDLSGGTISITNGGVFGSMLSTPLINPPQSAILGIHNITDRPVAIDGKVEIRPMMYIALSYDHRIIDGRESVGFLIKIKEFIEEPTKLLWDGSDPIQKLLDLQ